MPAFRDRIIIKDGDGKPGTAMDCLIVKATSQSATFKIPNGKDGAEMTLPMSAVYSLERAPEAEAAPSADTKEKTFNDVIELKGGTTISCAIKSFADGKITVAINDGKKGVEASFPQSAIKSVKSNKVFAVQYVDGAPLKENEIIYSEDMRLEQQHGKLGAVSASEGQIDLNGKNINVVNVVTAKLPDDDGRVSLWNDQNVLSASTSVTGKDGNKRSVGVTAELAYAAHGERKNMVDPKSIAEWGTEMKISYARTIANKPPPTPPKSPVTTDEGNASLDFEDNSLRRNPLLAVNRTNYHLLAYTRAEAGFNRPLDLRQYNVAAAGLGLISDQGGARVRIGLGYRNEDYITPGKRSLDNVSLDFGLRFASEIPGGKLDNDFTTILSASNNSRSKDTLSLKFGKDGGKLTFGPKVVWEYESRPEPTNKRLNTTYSTEAKLNF